MKQFVKKAISKFFQLYYMAKFSKELKKMQTETTIWIVDIDNTVAASWQTFNQNWTSEKERLANIPLLQGSVDYINSRKKEGESIIFLSARNYFTFDITYEWLRKYKLVQNKTQLFLVAFPKEKITFIKKAIGKNNKVIYIDDLTYNHEKGETKYYSSVIEAVKNLPIEYIDYDTILKLNNR